MAIGAYKHLQYQLQTNGYSSDNARPKSTRVCFNECCNSGEKSLACLSKLLLQFERVKSAKQFIIIGGSMGGKYESQQ